MFEQKICFTVKFKTETICLFLIGNTADVDIDIKNGEFSWSSKEKPVLRE